jgi:hypothetical protein
MARQKGSTKLGNNIELNAAAPLSANEHVKLKSDLTAANTWDYPFKGMKVVVEEEAKMYILKQLPNTEPENWVLVGADIDTSVIEAEIEKKAEGYIETTTATVAAGTDRPLVEGEIVKIKSSDGTKTYQGAVDDTGVATIDVEGESVTVENDATNGLTITAGTADVDTTEVEITTETVHKIDSRLLPKGQAVDTQDYMQAALTVKEAQGKYKVGDVIPQDTSLEDVIKNMLTKTNYPTITEPKATISGTGNKLLETGATQSVTITVTFDRGSISPAYGTDGYRAGEATAYSLNGGGEQVENTFSETVSESNASFTGTVKYAAGPQPKDDEGENYGEAKEAGSLTTSALVYEFVDPIYSNAANINTIAKEPLVKRSVGEKTFVFPPCTVANPEIFEVPAAWSVLAVEVLNDMSGKFEPCDEFVASDVVHPNAANVETQYNRYTDSRGYAAGSRTIKVRWS